MGLGMPICLTISDADWALTKDVLEVSISFLGVLIAGVLGTIGLFTWRRQIRGQNDHELARRLLINLYKLMEVFKVSRHRAIYVHEINRPGDPVFLGSEQDRYARQELGFHRRIKLLKEAYAEIAIPLFEAQALWGDKIVKVADGLRFLVDEYEDYIRVKLLSMDPSESEDERDDQCAFLAMRRNVLRNRLEAFDEFGSELEQEFKNLERALKLKLVR